MTKHATLGFMIDAFSKLPQDAHVPFLFCHAHSNRGYYERLGIQIDPVGFYEHKSNVSELLKFLKDQVGKSFGGWKVGAYVMSVDSLVCISESGATGLPITEGFVNGMVEMIEYKNNHPFE